MCALYIRRGGKECERVRGRGKGGGRERERESVREREILAPDQVMGPWG